MNVIDDNKKSLWYILGIESKKNNTGLFMPSSPKKINTKKPKERKKVDSQKGNREA
ncbi:MAG: hypothetical protein FWC97_09260 [Treponema sp.]|nr:hypothetical protein [Treponema sp.]